MSEWQLVWLTLVRIFAVVLYSFFYVLGGTEDSGGKWWRRWVGTPFFVLALIGISVSTKSFSWILTISILSFFLTIIFGYGGDDLWTKFKRRLLFASMFSVSSLIIGFTSGHIALGVIQAVLAFQASLVFGLINPVESVNEQFLIAFISTILLPFMV